MTSSALIGPCSLFVFAGLERLWTFSSNESLLDLAPAEVAEVRPVDLWLGQERLALRDCFGDQVTSNRSCDQPGLSGLRPPADAGALKLPV